MKIPVLLPLRAIQDPRESGGKAWGLARLLRGGLAVPDGFVVEARWYRLHLEACGAGEPIRALQGAAADLARPRGGTAGRSTSPSAVAVLAAILDDVRSRIEKAPLSDEVREALATLDGARQPVRWCFRSSATDEDGATRSMAGLHDSVLGCTGGVACEAALKRCWSSLWSPRAWVQRGAKAPGGEPAMAVVIQPLLDADVSGVVFTADPLGGGEDEIVLEVVYGLGEALVSGKVSPDTWCLGRPRLDVRKHLVGDKSVRVALEESADGSSRSVLRPVAQAMATRPAIDLPVARQVARAALLAEELVGCPVDVEWAMAGGRLHLLQARPITTLGGARRTPRPVWTRANVGEVMPDVVTPLSWELVQRAITRLFNDNLRRAGLDFGPLPPVGRVGGRVYFDLALISAMVHSVPFCSRFDLTLALGGHQDHLPAEELRRLMQRRVPVKLHPWRALVRLPLTLLWLLARTPGRQQAFLGRVRDETDERVRALGQDTITGTDELWRRVSAVVDRLVEFCEEFIAAGSGAAWHFVLQVVCRRWLGDRDGSLANRLLAGTGQLESAEAGYDLQRLAAEAARHGEVATILADGLAWDETRPRLAGLAAGRAFLERWDDFMFCHGHHARGEVELINPRWSEQPDVVLGWVRSWLRGPREDPASTVRASRDALLAECRSRLRNPLKRWVLEACRRRAASGIALREALKSQAVRNLAVARGLLLALGDRLVGRGLLEGRGDVFFCLAQELEMLSCEASPPGEVDALAIRQRVQERRAEYEACQRLDPPDVVIGDLGEGPPLEEPAPGSPGELQGTAVSPGIVEGPARVLVEGMEGPVWPGEILVLPHADPGWAPIFLQAAGIVLDLGGMLSHGCIIAREYGIPAVANVRTATRSIRTGMRLRVDGNAGRVYVLDHGEESSGAERGP